MKSIYTISERQRIERNAKIKAWAFSLVSIAAAIVVALDLFYWRAV